MSRKLMRTLAAGLLAALLTACGAEQGGGGAAQIDGSKVDVILTSAEPAAAGEETTLIAELTGATESAVESRLFRARQALRKKLDRILK